MFNKPLILLLFFIQISIAHDDHHHDSKKVLVISADHSSAKRVLLINKNNHDKNLEFTHAKLKTFENQSLAEIATDYDLLIFSTVSDQFAQKHFGSLLPIEADFSKPVVTLPYDNKFKLNNSLSEKQAQTINDYYRNGGKENMSRLGDFLNTEIFKVSKAKAAAPIIYPNQGIYFPQFDKKIFASLKDYTQQRGMKSVPENKPIVGILMRIENYGTGNNKMVDTLINKMEAKGIFTIPFYIDEYKSGYEVLFTENNKIILDNIINIRTMHAPIKRREQFENIGVPIIHAIQYYSGNQADWESNNQGVSPMMTPFMLSMPESAGVIDIITVSAADRNSSSLEVIDYQLDALVNRSLAYANLANKPNKDKKLTMMVWNYPSGEKNVSASFLNVPKSIDQITKALANNGYQVTQSEEKKLIADVNQILRPFYRDFELQKLLDDDLAELMPLETYKKHLNSFPEEITAQIIADWGLPKDGLMVTEIKGKNYLVIPRIKLGNLIIMRQPPRGEKADKEKSLYHDRNITINHYYLAAYFYAKKIFASDAIIHLGTHGSQEYLPGKERSLSVYDAAIMAIGDTPVIYPFIIDDVGEAMQAKRRGRAVIISHMTPPFAAAGLYAESMDMHELMHQYNSLTEGKVKELTLEKIISICIENSYCKDINWGQQQINKDVTGFLLALHDYLGELAAESQPLGLHTFGMSPEEKHVISSIIQMLGTEFNNLAIDYEAEHFSAQAALDHHQKHDESHSHDDDKEHSHHQQNTVTHEHSGKRHSHKEDEAHELTKQDSDEPVTGEAIEEITGFQLLKHYLIDNGKLEDINDKAIKKHVQQAQVYYKNFHQLAELESMLKALSGQYIKVTTGGDPIRNPDVVPTGFNLYGFDPAKVPTKSAWKAGTELTENLIADYYQQNGKYPEKMAFSLWSIETMRHFGVLEAQVMRAMGVRPIWSDDDRIIDTEIIPYSELKRPRVDVVLSVTGLYRDAFPNIIEWMAIAIAKVAKLKEDGNRLYNHAQITQKELEETGIDTEQAQYLSTVRIFSNKSGAYGSGLGSGVMASDTWEKDDKLAKVYLDKMGYFFGPKKGMSRDHWGQKISDVDLYAKTLSGTDMAVFSRTSNLYGLLTSDDPFQYLGGIALAVRNLDGKNPQLYISNLRDANNSKTETIQKFMAKELRNRSFHPRWVNEMKQEGYSGALAMLDNLNNFWGWQVVDPSSVRADQWQEFFEVYIEDKFNLELDEWFEQANNHTKAQMLERMIEAVRKDYWQADEKTLEKMLKEYIKQATEFDYKASNEKLVEFVKAGAQGYGMDLSAITVAPPAGTITDTPKTDPEAAQQNNPENITGVKLEQTKASTQEQDWNYMLLIAILISMLIFIFGIIMRYKE